MKKYYKQILGFIITIIISSIASSLTTYYVNRQIDNRVTYRSFIFDFGRVYFDNPKYRDISKALEEQYLYGKEDELANITDYEIDDYLGLISDIWSFYEDGFITKDLIENQYGYYLCITYKSKFINNYRKKLLTDGFSESESYSFLEDIADELSLKEKNCKGD